MITEERKREIREASQELRFDFNNGLTGRFPDRDILALMDYILELTSPEPAVVVPEREGQEELYKEVKDYFVKQSMIRRGVNEIFADIQAEFTLIRREAPEKPVALEGELEHLKKELSDLQGWHDWYKKKADAYDQVLRGAESIHFLGAADKALKAEELRALADKWDNNQRVYPDLEKFADLERNKQDKP